MTGFGIREQWQLSKQLAALDERLWRPESIMHQMSLNGSLVISKNHDATWINLLADLLNERGRGWTSLQWRLRAMPGNEARKLLWRSSYLWYQQAKTNYIRLAGLAWQGDVALQDTRIKLLEDELFRVKTQLAALAWCEKDTDRQPIKVVDIQAAVSASRSQAGIDS